MTIEQREKIRQYRLGKKHSPETLLKMSLAKKGFFLTWKGKHPTEETRKRMSEAMKRNPRPHQFKKGRIPSKEEKEKRLKTMAGKYKGENAFNWKGGIPHCQDCGKLLGARRFKRCDKCNGIFRRGENSPSWKGGISDLRIRLSSLFEYRQWRSDIFQRDDFTCVVCGLRGGYLEADHIKPYKQIKEEYNIKNIDDALACSELWNINNGRTVCRPCHLKTETFGNRKINNN